MLELADVTFATVDSVVWTFVTAVAGNVEAAANLGESDRVSQSAALKLMPDQVEATDRRPDAMVFPTATVDTPANATRGPRTHALRPIHNPKELNLSPGMPMTVAA